jgi:methionine sulfoxide reductase heme-binding subunit
MKAEKTDLSFLAPAVYLGALLPGALLIVQGLQGGLGANPIAEVLNGLGELGIKLLILSLACTPIRILTKQAWPLRVRKALGLSGFTYIAAHLFVYIVLDRQSLTEVVIDVVKRPFIAIGMIAFLTLVPLALTSTKRMLQRLGAKRWQRLHRLAYVASTLGVIHYVMRQKEDITIPLIHGGVLAFLFAVRLFDYAKKKKRAAPARAPSPS